MLSHNTTRILVLLLIVTILKAAELSVETSTGKLIGTAVQFTHEDIQHTVNIYKGIPYAEPPIGDLRFRPPVPKSPWNGEYDATYARSACMQVEFPLFQISDTLSEDCLYLNVFVPQHELKKYAVMVWIHGGGFTTGSGSPEVYDATPLAAINDVIVVTINYRLGPFGFLTTGDSVVKGNMGMLDQVEALKWVKNNIEVFGGDKERITIFGESAGAFSCHLHVLSPLSSDLFHRVILESGALSPAYGLTDDIETSVKVAHTLGKELGCEHDNSEDFIQCLRKVPAEDFIKSSLMEPLQAVVIGSELAQPFNPVVDDYFAPKDPFEKLSDGSFNKVDCIVGTNGDEGMMWVLILVAQATNGSKPFIDRATFDDLYHFFIFPSNVKYPTVRETVKYLYTDWDLVESDEHNNVESLSHITGDSFFVCPANKCVRDLTNAGLNVYQYHFTHHPSSSMWKTSWVKAAHGEEMSFVFGWNYLSQLHPDGGMQITFTDEEVEMSEQIMKYFTNFAKTSDPNVNEDGGKTKIYWPKFTVPELQYKEFAPSMVTKRALKARECAFWNRLQPELRKISDELQQTCNEV